MKPLLDQLRKMAEYNRTEIGFTLGPACIRDQAIILKLIEIIEEQSEALNTLSSMLRVDGNWRADQVLDLTESKLKALVEGKE